MFSPEVRRSYSHSQGTLSALSASGPDTKLQPQSDPIHIGSWQLPKGSVTPSIRQKGKNSWKPGIKVYSPVIFSRKSQTLETEKGERNERERERKRNQVIMAGITTVISPGKLKEITR